MKNVPCRDGIIYRYAKKYRRRRLITVVILICLLCAYAFSCRAYLSNAIFGSQTLDEERFEKEVQTRELGEEFELHRSEPQTIDAYALKAHSYWQDSDYEFDVKLKNPVRTDIVYTTANTDASADDRSMESAVVYAAFVGSVRTLVLAYPHHDLKDGDTVCGVFTGIPRIIEHDIAKSPEFDAESKICAYMLDIRGISMESQFADIVFCTLMLMLILYLAIRLIFQYVNPLLCPTYRSIDKYGDIGDIVENIESQLAGRVKNNKIKEKTVTENWIVSEDTFKLKIVKNHMQKH